MPEKDKLIEGLLEMGISEEKIKEILHKKFERKYIPYSEMTEEEKKAEDAQYKEWLIRERASRSRYEYKKGFKEGFMETYPKRVAAELFSERLSEEKDNAVEKMLKIAEMLQKDYDFQEMMEEAAEEAAEKYLAKKDEGYEHGYFYEQAKKYYESI